MVRLCGNPSDAEAFGKRLMERKMRKTLILMLALSALAACETVKGAGRDMQAAGAAVTREAGKAQSDM